MKRLVLDAMGVIYSARDDVAELLHPFIMEKGGLGGLERVSRIYIEASLGKMTSQDFWKAVGVDPCLEDEYLSRHSLISGLVDFLDSALLAGIELWCLSNDVSEWSKKLRSRYEIEGRFRGFIISGDVGLRKPDPAIYQLLIGSLGCRAGDILVVDDNVRNLDAAAGQGIKTVLFKSSGQPYSGNHAAVSSFRELREFIR